MAADLADIEPGRLYPFSEAAALVPSPCKGKRLHPETLHRWRRRGQLKAECRLSGRKRYWFVYGADLLQAMGSQEPPVIKSRSPARRRRDLEAVEARLRARGLPV